MTSSIKEPLSLFLLTLDERVDLYADVLGVTGKPSSAERERAAELKRVVFEGIRAAIEQGLPKPSVAIWADGDLGESVLLRAKAMSIATSASPGSCMNTVSHIFVDYIGIQLSFNPDSSHMTDEEKKRIKEGMGRLKRLTLLPGSFTMRSKVIASGVMSVVAACTGAKEHHYQCQELQSSHFRK